jgi:hypothetical protein
MVVVVPDAVLVTRRRAGRLDAAQEACLRQGPEDVVYRLYRDRTDLAPDRLRYDVGGRVWRIGDRPENSQTLGRDAKTAMTKGRTRVGVHSLDLIQHWSELQSGLAKATRLGYQVRVLSDFATETIEANGVSINVCRGGAGPPVLLLHGYPQTHVMWHRVAPVLAEHFTVLCPDLRGYGDSDKPLGGRDHAAYSKRTMAQDQLEVMGALGFERFAVAAHDRGARVALRMALDHPDAVSRLAILDIVPTKTIYETIDKR